MNAPRLHVDLNRFAANLAAVRERVAPAELLLVVKDDAYAHGMPPIVRRAVAEGVRWFGAFDVEEAVRVRAVTGPAARILSWQTVGADGISAALAADLDIGVGDAAFLEHVGSVAGDIGAAPRIHLKIDTGLHRNGIRPEEWGEALARARAFEDAGRMRVVGVWSHIAEASDEEDDAARRVFDDAVAAAEAARFPLEMRHLSASAASFLRPEFRYDMVRIGAFCYGIRPAGGPIEEELGILPIAALRAPVTHVGDHSLSLGVGALHGLPSSLAQRASLQGTDGRHALEHVGAMHVVLDAARGHPVVGDEFTVFGEGGSSATDLAEAIGTVGEEIVLRISPLVPRVYLGD